jgi:5-(carboxyamino)imidazole ribonucleotide synthase
MSSAPAALAPGSTIGILGSGQLGRMLALAAARLGLRCHVYSDETGPAFDVAAARTVGGYDDGAALDAFARAVDVVTYEFENVPVAAAERLARTRPVRPGPRALAVSQDRLEEKRFIADLGIAVAPFAPVGSPAELAAAVAAVGTPAILKTRRLGYDGKGQELVASPARAAAAFDRLVGASSILEGVVPFAREISALVVRGLDGALAAYDCPLNTHAGGILRRSVVPAPSSRAVIAEAHAIGRRIAEALDYVGVLAVELFEIGPEQAATLGHTLLVNEIAPRVHNSGHWTTDACLVSQFENHIRAVAGWPLGATGRHSDAEMINLIGREVLDWPALAAAPDTAVHIYGKRDARDGRKMGHVNKLRTRPG